MLTDERFHIPSCRECHDWIEKNRKTAQSMFWFSPVAGKEIRILAIAGEWLNPKL